MHTICHTVFEATNVKIPYQINFSAFQLYHCFGSWLCHSHQDRHLFSLPQGTVEVDYSIHISLSPPFIQDSDPTDVGISTVLSKFFNSIKNHLPSPRKRNTTALLHYFPAIKGILRHTLCQPGQFLCVCLFQAIPGRCSHMPLAT